MPAVEIISFVLLFFYVALIGVYWIGWMLIPRFTAAGTGAAGSYFFSVLVPARNEEAHIEACVRALAAQDFNNARFEIIVIDDRSTDRTAQIVESMAANGVNVRLIRMNTVPGAPGAKKAAITAGISAARGGMIVLTDADCTRGKSWLSSIDAFVESSRARMIYAPVAFTARTFFERVQALEFAGLVGIGAAAIRLRNPNMCSAANLVFSKRVFEEVGGYSGNDGIASGDDEFLLHKVFRKYPRDVHFMKCREAIVSTSANTSLAQLTDQRRRWVSKSTKYENRYITLILVAAYLFNALIVFNLFFNWKTGLTMLVCKTVAEGLFLADILRFFGRTAYLALLLPAELFHIIYVLIIGIWANIGSYTWKGRQLK